MTGTKKINNYKKTYMIETKTMDRTKEKTKPNCNKEKPQDLTVHNHNLSYISQNILSLIKQDLLEFFSKLSFDIEFETEIVHNEDNFDNLLINSDHPSRSSADTFYLSPDLLLRTHCTCNSVKKLRQKGQQIKSGNHITEQYKLVTIGPVYRKDDEDSRHTEQFNQIDILWVHKNLNLRNLKWLMVETIKHIFGSDIEYRFRNSYFPFTQPSYELDMKCLCNQIGSCSTCSGTGWIEILGCGMLHKKILENSNYPSEYDALAAGIGIERLAMIKYKLSDIRPIYQNNFRQLKHDC